MNYDNDQFDKENSKQFGREYDSDQLDREFEEYMYGNEGAQGSGASQGYSDAASPSRSGGSQDRNDVYGDRGDTSRSRSDAYGERVDAPRTYGETASRGHSRRKQTGPAGNSYSQAEDPMPSGPSRGRKGGGTSGKGIKSRRKTLIVRAVVFAVLEVFTLIGLFGFAYASKQYGKLQRPDVSEDKVLNFNLTEAQRAEMEKGYWNIAVFGVDTRDSSVGKGANSDVIIVVSINRETGAIQLVSVFRDTYLKVGDDSYNKINSAYCKGGPEQALKALNENLDLNITQYVTFNWKAVATGINILGGVDIDISKAEYNWINGYITETVKSTGIGSTQLTGPGLQHLDGVQAVAYARLRYMDNDYARTERQRKVIGEVFKKAKQTDLNTLNSLIGVMLEMVATNMTWQDGLDALGNIDKYNITETAGFPFARGEANMGKCGACVIPQTLESNDRDLHTMLFADEAYEPSDQVKQISAYISAKTGMYSEGVNIGHVSTEGWISSGSGKSGTGAVTEDAEKEEESTEAESISKKNDDREYAISMDGYLIYVDGYDANGNKLYKYVKDADGNRIKMVEEDENGNLVYLYEIDEDGNFYFTQNEELNTTETEEKIYETDEDGNILPGQEEETEYGPGGATQKAKETVTSEYGKPVENPTEEYGPGVEREEEGPAAPGEEDENITPGTVPGSGSGTESENEGPGGSGVSSETVENLPN